MKGTMEEMTMTEPLSGSPTRPTVAWLPEIRRDLAGLILSPEWPEESVGVPGSRSRQSADCALRLLAELDLRPVRLRPSLDGGVAFAFATHDRYAEVEFLDSGEVVATCSHGSAGTVSPASDLRTTLRAIQAFLGG
jgi:hypothetical protein